MHIASHAYTANREATSHFEGSKKELSLKTATTHRTETIKKMLSESGPESVLANKGKYSHTRTFAAGRDQRAILAFSPANKRVDGFVMNKDQQLVPIKPYDLPKELQQILSSDAFEAFLNDIHARLIPLHNGDFRLDLHQGLKGGVHSNTGNIKHIKENLENTSNGSGSRNYQSKIIIKNECAYPLELTHQDIRGGSFATNHPLSAFEREGEDFKIPSGAAGGIFCNGTRGLPKPIEGYVSLRIPTPGRNYTVICAFSTGYFGPNSAKIELRCEDGNTNELGIVVGHGVDATGHVTDMNALFAGCFRHQETSKFTRSNLGSRMFRVYCRFDNQAKANFYFTFTNPDAHINPNPAPAPQPRPKPEEDPKPAPVAPLVITIDGSLVDRLKTMWPGIPEQNHNPKTEEKAEEPVPDQEPVDNNLSGMADNMQNNREESVPVDQPQANSNMNSAEWFTQVGEKVPNLIENLVNSDSTKNFISNVRSVFQPELEPGKKAENKSEELKKEDKQNEPSE